METAIPIWVIAIPVIGAFALLFKKDSDQYRNAVVVSACTLPFLLLLGIYSRVIAGGVATSLSWLPGFELTFKVDSAGLLVALFTALLWILCSIFSITYMTMEKNRFRYDFFSLLTLATNLGVLLAGDFFTLFIFFEGLLLFPYPLIAHKEDAPAIKGANLYLYVGVATSLLLLSGMVLLKNYAGTLAIQPLAADVAASMSGGLKFQIAALMVVGFGGKAGLFFEHFWLPEAHPVAPSPASALLSAAMIKAGAYGIFRVVNMLFVPQDGSMADWLTLSNIGYVTILMGTITMFLAVISALLASNSKRMLAFHSISQMGYIVMGIGCAAYLGREGAMGVAGALYHIVNHALFKAALFLGVGAVYFRTKELDMYKLGGLWQNMPVTAICLLIAVCGISGIPFFNGFASKTILHHAIIESYEHGHDTILWIVEKIFILTAAGTFASNMKLFMLTFRGKRPEKYKNVEAAPLPMRVGMIGFAVAILFLGFFPNWLLETAIGPALASLGFDAGSHAYQLLYDVRTQVSGLAILYPGAESFSVVLHNLFSGVLVVLLGVGLMFGGMKFGWFHLHLPKFATFDFYATKALGFLLNPWSVLTGNEFEGKAVPLEEGE
ncbi:MAG: complex I subunit 5 family protein [Nitrospiria bacterium]